MQNIKITNSLEMCVIDIEGVIGIAEEWQFDNAGERVATYEKFRECVAQIGELDTKSVVVNIRSTGGDVNDAMLIYEALASLEIPITTRCYGYVASAATVIAQAASEGQRQISANALYLVHNSTCTAEGNISDLESKCELLRKTDERLAELYARRSSRPAEEFTSLMNEESGNGHWLTAQEAIEAGLADTLIDSAADKGEERSSIKNFWRKIGERLGFSELELSLQEVVSNEHSVLHPESNEQQAAAKARLFAEQQCSTAATKLHSVEDPSLVDAMPTANQRAYETDAQAFR